MVTRIEETKTYTLLQQHILVSIPAAREERECENTDRDQNIQEYT
jgi:hypothetical protein